MNIIRSIGLVSCIKALGKISALLRDRVIAQILGAGSLSDAFFISFNFNNVLKNVVGEESLKASFLPLFTEYHTREQATVLWRMVNTVINSLLIVLAVLSVITVVVAPDIAKFVGFGVHDAGQMQLIVTATRIQVPFIALSSIATLLLAMLTVLGHFMVPAALPIIMNLVMIAVVYLLYTPYGIYALAAGVVAGSALQLCIQIPLLYKEGYRYRPVIDWRHPVIRRLLALMLPVVITQGLIQGTILVDTGFASTLEPGSVSYLYFGNRIMLFPYDVLGMAISMVVFPYLAQAVTSADFDKLRQIISNSLQLLLFLGLPVTFGFIVLARPIADAILAGQEFSQQAVAGTAMVLVWYMTGFLAFVGIRLIYQVFYAFKDTTTPLIIGIICLVLNILFDFILIRYMSYSGLALSSSLVGLINAGILVALLARKIKGLAWRPIVTTLWQSLAGSLVMAGLCWQISQQLLVPYGKYVQVLGVAIIGTFGYLSIMYLIRNKEMMFIKEAVIAKKS
jgi:putative peptidoglycan lipid II flippase